MKKIFLAAILFVAAASQSIHAETVVSDQMRAVRNDFQDRKFGIFLHWGIYSMLGDGEWVMNNQKIPYQEYARFAGGFYPSKFNAEEWIKIFKEAGADVVMCGHTHNGQVFPGNLIIPLFNENAWGYVNVHDLHTLVTAGVGYYGPPMRVGTDSEISVINLTFQQESEQ